MSWYQVARSYQTSFTEWKSVLKKTLNSLTDWTEEFFHFRILRITKRVRKCFQEKLFPHFFDKLIKFAIRELFFRLSVSQNGKTWFIMVCFLSKPMLPLFFGNFRKKVLNPNGPYIGTNQITMRNVFMSVCSSSTYTWLCRGLKYLLKVPYIIQDYLNVVEFLISETLCLGRSKTLACVWKNITKVNGICVWKDIALPNLYRINV